MKNYFFLVLILTLSVLYAKDEAKLSQKKTGIDFKNMKLIKGGEFIMGTMNDRYGDKIPHPIEVSDFYIDITEVTNDNNRKPMVNISYTEALEYCEKIGKTLPSEAQWEYAARGGMSSKIYPWGDVKNSSLLNDRDSKIFKAKAVKFYMPNSYGLYEMSGNVREWVKDSYSKYFYKSLNKKDPINNMKTTLKVTRGGSFDYSNGYPATVSFRSYDSIDSKYDDLGFRCAYSVNQIIQKEESHKEKKNKKLKLKEVNSSKSEIVNTRDTTEIYDKIDENGKRYKIYYGNDGSQKRRYLNGEEAVDDAI